MTRELLWEGAANVRDLGGLPTRDGGRIRRGALVRAGHLDELSPAGWRALADHGVRTVLDLRCAVECLEVDARPPEIEVRRIEILEESDLVPLPESTPVVAIYRDFLERRGAAMAEAVRSIALAWEGGVVVHCYAGRDRTGLVCALALEVAGVPAEEIAADYALSPPYWDTIEPATMLATLEGLERRAGGAEPYLRANGVTATELVRLRARLREP